jgi:hypothetical protein
MAHFSLLSIGDKLVIGALDTSFLDANSKLFPGTLVANGPVYFGLNASVGVPRATVMIGAPIGLGVPASLEVLGISNFVGNINLTGVINRIAVTNASGATVKTGISVKKALAASTGLSTKAGVQQTAGAKVMQSIGTVKLFKAKVIWCSNITANYGKFAGVAAPFKQFDIPHPNKPGKRLIHACIEGPEIGVYHRGKLIGNNVIELPDYWVNLIDPETITVHLTPHEFYQELFVKNIEWGRKINVVNNAGGPINCSYVVYAERIDVEKLQIEKDDIK